MLDFGDLNAPSYWPVAASAGNVAAVPKYYAHADGLTLQVADGKRRL